MKQAFLNADFLTNVDRRLPTIIKTDASNQAIAGCLLQLHKDTASKGQWKTVDFHSSALNANQRNWPIYDKELWGIVLSLNHWRSWLAGLDTVFKVHTDHQGLQYFFTKQRLNSHQAAWGQKLSEFNFKVFYILGTHMERVDAISRRYGNEEAGGYDKLLTQRNTPATQTTHPPQAQVLLLDEHELDPLPGVDISNWPRNVNGL